MLNILKPFPMKKVCEYNDSSEVFEMKDIIKTLIICILFIALLISGWGYELEAIKAEAENEDYSNSTNASESLGNEPRSASPRGTDID